MNPMTICVIIFIITLISFALNKIPMYVSAILAVIALYITGCLTAKEALSGFSNTNVILIASMFVVAAGLEKTTYIDELCKYIMKITNGSFKKAYLGYIIVAVVLSNFTNSIMVTYAIIAPLLITLCEKNNESPSKYIFPILVVIASTMGVLPLSGAVTNSAMFNGLLESMGVTDVVVKPMDFFVARWPMLIAIPIWAYFWGPKVCPQTPVVEPKTASSTLKDKKPLSKFSNIMGLFVFSITLLALIFSKTIGVSTWSVALSGAMFMVVFNVLKGTEATKTIPVDLIILVAGALGLGSALTKTGAGKIIGDTLGGIITSSGNSFVASALFFIVPFVLTQFMFNRAVTQIFATIAILICSSLNANPVGPIILVYAGATTAFFTPMGTPATAMAMANGGYDLKALFKSGRVIATIMIVIYVAYMSIVFPIY